MRAMCRRADGGGGGRNPQAVHSPDAGFGRIHEGPAAARYSVVLAERAGPENGVSCPCSVRESQRCVLDGDLRRGVSSWGTPRFCLK